MNIHFHIICLFHRGNLVLAVAATGIVGLANLYQKQMVLSEDACRILRSYPGPWQIHLVKPRGADECIHLQVCFMSDVC